MEIFGWGRKNTADVTAAGKLKTWATSFSEDHFAAINGDAYIFDLDGTVVGADGNWLFVWKNTHNSKNLVVTRIHLVPNDSSDDQELEVYVGGTFSYLAEGTAVVPTNLLAGKVGGAQGSFYKTDGTVDIMTTVTTGLIAGRFPMPLKKEYDCRKNSNWIVPPNECFMASCSKDEKFRGFVSFYYHD